LGIGAMIIKLFTSASNSVPALTVSHKFLENETSLEVPATSFSSNSKLSYGNLINFLGCVLIMCAHHPSLPWTLLLILCLVLRS